MSEREWTWVIVLGAFSGIFGSIVGFIWTTYMPAPYNYGLLLPVAILSGLTIFFVSRWWLRKVYEKKGEINNER